MVVRTVIAAALALCASLAPARAAGPFDGTYTGQGQLVPGGSFDCPTEYGPRQAVVSDGAFTYTHNRAVKIDAKIGPDGSVSGSAYTQTARGGTTQKLSGKASGDTLDLTSANDRCTYHVVLKKKA